MILSKQGVVFRQAVKNIARDQLIVAADLAPLDVSQQYSVAADNAVKTAGEQLQLSRPMLALGAVLIHSGVLASGYGYLALIVLAFRKSFLWGLSYIFVPFASVVFKLQNWARARRYFHALLIGCTLAILGGMLLILHLEAPLSL